MSDRIPNEGADTDDTDNRLEKLLADRHGELSTMHHQAEEYWLSQEKEIKLRAYHQFDFGGYHSEWLDELWALHQNVSMLNSDGDPLGWFISRSITPEEEGFYLDSSSYLIDLEDGARCDREEGDCLTEFVLDRDSSITTTNEHARRLITAYFTGLITILRRLLKLFVMQNTDLMANSPTFKRLFYMEREATLGIVEYLQEEMKRRADSPDNGADVTASK